MHPWSIARRLFVGQLLFIVCATVVVSWVVVTHSRDTLATQAAARMSTTAVTLADSPFVAEGLRGGASSDRLRAYTLDVTAHARLDFITVMRPNRTRVTHPNPAEIGRPYLGTVEPALRGQVFTETYTGTLGPSVRAIAPVKDDAGTVIGMVAVGQTTASVESTALAQLPAILSIAALFAAAGAIVSVGLNRYLRRVTFGQGPEQLARMVVVFDAALHSVDDGLVLTDDAHRVLLYNDVAADLLGLPPAAAAARPVALADVTLPPSIAELVRTGRRCEDEVHVAGARILVVTQRDAVSTERTGRFRGFGIRADRRIGRMLTVRDHTELTAIAGELQTTRTLSDALRAQTHEHANRLHTVLTLLELGRAGEAAGLIAGELSGSAAGTGSADPAVAAVVPEPRTGALLAAKAAQGRERGVDVTVEAGAGFDPTDREATALLTVLGNLIDNALDAAASAGPAGRWVHVALGGGDGELEVSVADGAAALTAADVERIFTRGFSTKPVPPDAPRAAGRGVGLALVRQAVASLGGDIDVDVRDGTVFTVAIPHQPAADAADADTVASPAPPGFPSSPGPSGRPRDASPHRTVRDSSTGVPLP
ncbi:histidine kinase [Tersicoccus solisilvae]|uniref:histidine kinase n=1 Tax=Tersicoccus solisilvae TaxID=1882339 RepID=A0ABQ1NUQ6_9MICC|nr:ATP-binding protein [Tersicoccus solisilvae]GGC83786.1 histidine kinase [Tersicoccus solisilvae]